MNSEDSEIFQTNESGIFPPQLLQETRYCLLYKIRIDNRFYIRKQLKPEYAVQPAHVFSINKEFAIGQNLIHPQLISYLFKNETAEGVSLISAFIDGISLRQAISQSKNLSISHRKALLKKVIYPLLNAISYLHQKNIAHGDLKPENIILTNDESVLKIIDLGHAISPEFRVQGGGSLKYQWNESTDVAEDMDAYKASDLQAAAAILLEVYNGSPDESGLYKLPSPEKSMVKDLLSGKVPVLKHRPLDLKYVYIISILVLVFATSLIFKIFLFKEEKRPSKQVEILSGKQAGYHSDEHKEANNPSVDTLVLRENQQSSWAYGFGLRLKDSVLNSNEIRNMQSADEMKRYRNELIVINHKRWEDTLVKLNIYKGNLKYQQLLDDYQRGYLEARKISDLKFMEWAE